MWLSSNLITRSFPVVDDLWLRFDTLWIVIDDLRMWILIKLPLAAREYPMDFRGSGDREYALVAIGVENLGNGRYRWVEGDE